MPIIFAQAIMFIPAAVAGIKSDTSQSIVALVICSVFFGIIYATLIVVFTLYTRNNCPY
jgi:preprotein translocase subunit SecY